MVYTDASIRALGAVLFQRDDGGIPIWFARRLLLSAEKQYTVQELECPDVMFARKKFKHYLEKAEWICYTDHQAIINIMSTNSLSARIQRWRIALFGENLTVHHVAGKDKVVADCLSRIPCIKPSDITASISSLLNSPSVEEPILLAELL